jgi:hypothetical protein
MVITYYIHITLYRQALSTRSPLFVMDILLIRKLSGLSHQNNHFRGQNKEPGGQPPDDSGFCAEPSGPDGFLAVGDSQVQDASIKVRTRNKIANLRHFMSKAILQGVIRA